jgi:ABC-type antimicrobial peptide transport system permease subunit
VSVSPEPVPHSRFGQDHRRVAEFAPELADGHAHGLRERVGVLVPGLLQEPFGGDGGTVGAQQAVDTVFTGMLLGLGAVALLVGGVGVANTMVISVLERRSEIGLRRSLGATRGQIRVQFLAESLLLSALGGLGGVLIGTAVTAVYASSRVWPAVVPYWASVGGVAATLFIGAVAGLYPAIRASRLSPTEALSAQ